MQADSIAMDIKTAPERYHVVGTAAEENSTAAGDGRGMAGSQATTNPTAARIRESISVIRGLTTEYEFRTTVVDPIVTEDDIRSIVTLLEPGERYTLAAFRPGKTLDPDFAEADPPSSNLLARYAEIARERGLDVRVREHRIGGG